MKHLEVLSDWKAEAFCNAEGWDSLYCSSCDKEIPRIKYHHQPAYQVKSSGDILCYECAFCRECEEELVYTKCENPECDLFERPARKKDFSRPATP